MKLTINIFIFFILICTLSCSQGSRLGSDPVFQDGFLMDDGGEDEDDADDPEDEDVIRTEGAGVPAGIKLATTLQCGLNFSRCELVENGSLRYARLFGIIRTECSNSNTGVITRDVRVYYTFDHTNWFRVSGTYIGYSNNKRFQRFYFASGVIPYDPRTASASPVVEFKLSYVKNGSELWCNGFKSYFTTPDPEKAPLAKDGSKYTQSVAGIFHIMVENLKVFPVYNDNQAITGYRMQGFSFTKYVPAYQISNNINTKLVSFHCMTWPTNWSPVIGNKNSFTGGSPAWTWGNAFANKYLLGYYTNLGRVDPLTSKNYYYKHYTNGYEAFYLDTVLPATTRGIQFAIWSETWNTRGVKYTYYDKMRCRRYWIAMPTNGGTNILSGHFGYNFSEYLKSTGPVTATTIPQ